jgi:DNA-binding transcriptional ArsR family regulator
VVEYGMTVDQLSTTFAALADPTRRAILARLATGEATVTELAEPFTMSLPAISKHLKVLENAGLITRTRTAQWRPCQLEAAPLKRATDWLAEYRRFWDASFDRLDEHLRDLQRKDAWHPPVSTQAERFATAPQGSVTQASHKHVTKQNHPSPTQPKH